MSRQFLIAILLGALTAAAGAQTPPVVHVPGAAPPTDVVMTTDPSGRHTLNLRNADIHVLISTVAEITGRSFIVDPAVQGQVTVISGQPMAAEEIYRVFESVLRVHQFAAVPSGNMIKIVPAAAAVQDPGPMPAMHGPEALVTRIIEVRNVRADELVQLLRPLVPQHGHLSAHPSSNSLLVTDRAGNVERLHSIIQRIDTASDGEVEVIALRHASAAELVRTLTALEQAPATGVAVPGGPIGGGARLMADTRTNSVLLSGDRAQRLRLRALITHLDTPLDSGENTQVVYLRYARAEDLVPVLDNVAATLTGDVANPETARSATIQAHGETNALVITASASVFRELSAVIRQLDVRRAQVLVEAIIAEVSDELADELGIQWQTTSLDSADDHGFLGGTNFPNAGGGRSIVGGLTDPLGAVGGAGLNLGYLRGRITIPGPGGEDITVFQIGALLRALRGDGRANVLSTPSLVTLDHHEAEIKVGQEVPFLTGQYTNTSTTGGTNQPTNPFQTIERKDVGLQLTVTPHINEGDSVRLDLTQIVSSLAPTAAGAVDLITNKRELRTSVMVADGGMLVLGGLSSEEVRESVQGVPGLSRIPGLGALFRSRASNRVKRNLMIFLRPQILRDAVTEEMVSSDKYNFLRAEQLRLREQPASRFRGEQQPALPPLPDYFSNPPPLLPVPVPERPPQ